VENNQDCVREDLPVPIHNFTIAENRKLRTGWRFPKVCLFRIFPLFAVKVFKLLTAKNAENFREENQITTVLADSLSTARACTGTANQ
jgi:hypothetical protein